MTRWLLVLTVLPLGCKDTLREGEVPPPEPPVEMPTQLLPADRGLRSVADFENLQGDARSVALFEEVGKVLLHPRCVNCHPNTRRPLQGNGIPHHPWVVGAEDGHGVAGQPCTTCHGPENFRNVPGNPKWHLAPLEMAWEGRSLAAICRQLLDKERNGGKTRAELAQHMAEDHLVSYGWNPPAHLEPAPGNQALAGQLFQAWLATGAVCPPP